MPFTHPDPLQQTTTSAAKRMTALNEEWVVVAGVPGKRIRVKSWSFNTYGPGQTNMDVIDRLGGDDKLLREDMAIAAGAIAVDADDDGVAFLRAGASLVIKNKAALVSNVRVNYWIV